MASPRGLRRPQSRLKAGDAPGGGARDAPSVIVRRNSPLQAGVIRPAPLRLSVAIFRSMSDLPPPDSRYITLRNAFFSGVILVAPLAFTVYVFSKIIGFVGETFKPLFFAFVPDRLRDRPSLDALWDILATLIVIALVTLLGYVSRYVLGKYFFSIGGRFIQNIPGVSAVYNTVRQIVNTFSSKSRHMFNKVVLVEFPRKGCWTIGFLTNTVRGEAQARADADELW